MKRENINTLIAGVGIILATVSLIYDCSQSTNINKLNYKVVAAANSPVLQIIDKPNIVSADIFIPYKIDDIVGKNFKLEDELLIKFDDLKLEIKFKNTGNNTAHVIASTQGDVYKGDYYIRDVLFGKIDSPRVRALLRNEFFKSSQIHPGKERLFDFVSENVNTKDNKLIKHVMLLYENDIGMFFDTYCWISIDFVIQDPNAFIDKHDYGGLFTVRKNNNVVAKQYIAADVMDVKCDYKIYSEEEADTVLEEIYRLCADCKEKKDS